MPTTRWKIWFLVAMLGLSVPGSTGASVLCIRSDGSINLKAIGINGQPYAACDDETSDSGPSHQISVTTGHVECCSDIPIGVAGEVPPATPPSASDGSEMHIAQASFIATFDDWAGNLSLARSRRIYSDEPAYDFLASTRSTVLLL